MREPVSAYDYLVDHPNARPWHPGVLGNVAEIEIQGLKAGGGIGVRTKEGEWVEFRDANGMRWFGPGGWCSRDYVDELLGHQGAARTVEAMWRLISRGMERQWDALVERRRQDARVQEAAWEQVHKYRQEVNRSRANGRHLALREWRGNNPVPRSEMPEQLRAISGIRRLSPDQPCHVYFLVHEGEVVYVGQTGAPWPSRIESHIGDPDKVFDEVWHLPVDRDSIDEVERRYIEQFQPKYNKRHTKREAA